MIFRNLDNSNDWTFGLGVNNYVSLNTAIGLDIKTRLMSWLGDCFFDQNAGVDWWNRLGSKGQFDLLVSDLKRIISQTQNVTGLLSFSAELNGRDFSASYTVQTIYSKSFTDSISLGGL